MLELITTTKFRKDYKRAKRRGLDLNLLKDVINTLLEEKKLDSKYHDHQLSGNFAGFRECHIQPDWLLIYYTDHNDMVLVAARTGSHSELLDT